MNITRVYFDKATEEDKKRNKKLVGFADIVINHDFIIHDINMMEGDKGYYLLFPQNYKGKSIAFPVTNEARLEILNAIVQAKEYLEQANG